jgi:hypothetical protein
LMCADAPLEATNAGIPNAVRHAVPTYSDLATEYEKIRREVLCKTDQNSVSEGRNKQIDLLTRLIDVAPDAGRRRAAVQAIAALIVNDSLERRTDDGIKRLTVIERTLIRKDDSEDAAIIAFQRLSLADSLEADSCNYTHVDLHGRQMKRYKEFLEEYPNGRDAPEASFLVAKELEHEGSLLNARAAYLDVAKRFPESAFGKKAEAAANRLGKQ